MTTFHPHLKERFLEVLEETCSVQDAAAAVGVARSVAYYQRKADLGFAKRWDEALNRALDDLLGVAHRRAVAEKSDRLLEVLLKFRYGDRMADRLAVKVEGSIGLDPDALLQMDDADRRALQELLGKYTHAEQGVLLEHDRGEA